MVKQASSSVPRSSSFILVESQHHNRPSSHPPLELKNHNLLLENQNTNDASCKENLISKFESSATNGSSRTNGTYTVMYHSPRLPGSQPHSVPGSKFSTAFDMDNCSATKEKREEEKRRSRINSINGNTIDSLEKRQMRELSQCPRTPTTTSPANHTGENGVDEVSRNRNNLHGNEICRVTINSNPNCPMENPEPAPSPTSTKIIANNTSSDTVTLRPDCDDSTNEVVLDSNCIIDEIKVESPSTPSANTIIIITNDESIDSTAPTISYDDSTTLPVIISTDTSITTNDAATATNSDFTTKPIGRRRVKVLGKRKFVMLSTTRSPIPLQSMPGITNRTYITQSRTPSLTYYADTDMQSPSRTISPTSDINRTTTATGNDINNLLTPQLLSSPSVGISPLSNSSSVPSQSKEIVSTSTSSSIDPRTTMNATYIQGSCPNFWICPKCKHIPIPFRARHSVIYHATTNHSKDKEELDGTPTPPTIEDYPIIQVHLKSCAAKCRQWELYKDNLDELKTKDEDAALRLFGFNYDLEEDEGTDEDDNDVKEDVIITPKRQRRGTRISTSPVRYHEEVMTTTLKRHRRRNRKAPSPINLEEEITTIPKKQRGQHTRKGKSSKEKHTKLAKINNDKDDSLKKKDEYISSSTEKDTISSAKNGIVDVSDLQITAAIDVLLLSRTEVCSYIGSEDTIAYLRQKKLPDGFPGLECKYCLTSGSERKKWFFNSPKQLACGFSKIEQHLMKQCPHCPQSVVQVLGHSKKRESTERSELRENLGIDKVTRLQYADHVFGRLTSEDIHRL